MKVKLKEKLKFFARTNRKISILVDTIKGFIIALILITLIFFFLSAIVHNILRVVEASNEYSGKYKKLYTAGDGMMNLYSKGEGYRTIVILPDVGTSSPVMKYKALSDALSTEYRVIIAEPLGYGYSLSTKDDRTLKNMVGELREAFKNAEIGGPYILLTFSNSSLYADYYSREFPDEVIGIVSVNPMFAQSLESEKFKNKYLPNIINNAKFYSVLSFSGIFRWKSYIKPQDYSIDKMQENNSYGKNEIKLFRNRLANKFLTKEMRKEIYKLKDNMKELSDFKYSDNLQTLQVITANYRDEYLDRGENISRYANNLITNKNLQKVRTIDKPIDNYLYTADGIKALKNLISNSF